MIYPLATNALPDIVSTLKKQMNTAFSLHCLTTNQGSFCDKWESQWCWILA